MAVFMGNSPNQTSSLVGGPGGTPSPTFPMPAVKPSKGFDLNNFMTMLLLLSPVFERQIPGAGVGIGQAVMAHKSQLERQEREMGIGLSDYFSRVDDKDLGVVSEMLISSGYPEKMVRSTAKSSRAFRPKKSPLEIELDRLGEVLAPELAQSRITGQPVQQFLTPERVRALQASGQQIPFDVESADVVIGTRPVTEEVRFPITRPPLVTRTSLAGPQPTEATMPVTRQQPVLERRETVVVRGARANAVPMFGELFPAANDSMFGRTKIPVDKDGRPDLNEASQIAARLGWVRTEADLQAQRERHQQFLRDKMVAHFAGEQKVHVPTLVAQMQELGMVPGAEIVDARKRAKEEEKTSMVTVKDPVTGQMVTIPATSLPSVFPRRAPGEQDEGDRVRSRQMEARRIEAESDLEAAQEEKKFLLANVPEKTIADPADPRITKPNPEFSEWRKRLAVADITIRKSRAILKGLDRVEGRTRAAPSGQQGFESLPDPAKHRGRIIRDTRTNKRFKSDGKRWVEVK